MYQRRRNLWKPSCIEAGIRVANRTRNEEDGGEWKKKKKEDSGKRADERSTQEHHEGEMPSHGRRSRSHLPRKPRGQQPSTAESRQVLTRDTSPEDLQTAIFCTVRQIERIKLLINTR